MKRAWQRIWKAEDAAIDMGHKENRGVSGCPCCQVLSHHFIFPPNPQGPEGTAPQTKCSSRALFSRSSRPRRGRILRLRQVP